MLKGIQLIIFDIDGTLFDSVAFNTNNINRALEVLGYTYRVTADVVRSNLGCTAEDFYQGVLDHETFKDWRRIRQEARAHVGEMIATYGKSFEGVYETFEALAARGMKLVLYSNCSRPYLEAAVECIGIGPFLDYTECVKDNGLTKSELIAKILKRYPGLPAVVVGDRIHDKEAAEANGLPCIAAYYGFGRDEMKDVLHKIEHMEDLLQIIE